MYEFGSGCKDLKYAFLGSCRTLAALMIFLVAPACSSYEPARPATRVEPASGPCAVRDGNHEEILEGARITHAVPTLNLRDSPGANTLGPFFEKADDEAVPVEEAGERTKPEKADDVKLDPSNTP